jgi:hypothetical protein
MAGGRTVSFNVIVIPELFAKHGDPASSSKGRAQMIQASLESMKTLYTFCPELARLRDRIKETP